MGASLQARNNPARGHGIVPGTALHLRYTAGSGYREVITQVEKVDERGIGVLVPMMRLQKHPLPLGRVVEVQFNYQNRWRQFVTEVIGHSEDGQLDYLSHPARVDSRDRRRSFRLQTAIRPRCIFRIVVDETTVAEDREATVDGSVTDLSEGGLCLSTRDRVRNGERLGIQLDLPGGEELTARMRVVDIEEPERGRVNRKVHCEFTNITLADQDRIARFLMRRQLEMRRRGQL